MTEKELKRLSRGELLELLLMQTRETERLQEEVTRLQAQLDDRKLRVNKAGSIAKAALEVNGVMEAAQAAAAQYLENIKMVEAETRRKSAALERELQEQIAAAKAREAEAKAIIARYGKRSGT